MRALPELAEGSEVDFDRLVGFDRLSRRIAASRFFDSSADSMRAKNYIREHSCCRYLRLVFEAESGARQMVTRRLILLR